MLFIQTESQTVLYFVIAEILVFAEVRVERASLRLHVVDFIINLPRKLGFNNQQ